MSTLARTSQNVCLLAVAAMLSVYLFCAQKAGFNATDWSSFVDTGYRVATGQRIYLDFAYQSGPVFPYLLAAFIKLFGVGSWSMGMLLILNHLAAVLCIYLIARRFLQPAGVCFAVILAAASFSLPSPGIYYEHVAMAFALAGMTALILGSGVVGGAIAGAAVIAAFFTKANVGLANAIAVALVYLFTRRQRSSWIALFAGVLAGMLLITALVPSWSAFWEQNFAIFGGSERIFSTRGLMQLWSTLRNTPYILFGLYFLLVVGLGIWNASFAVLFFAFLSMAIFTNWTSSMPWRLNTLLLAPLWLFTLALCECIPMNPPGTPEWRIRRSLLVVTWLMGITMTVYCAAQSFRASIPSRLPESLEEDSSLSGKFAGVPFSEWKCPKPICESVEQTAKWMHDIPAEETVLVFPDTTILYAMSGHPSYPGAPWAFQIEFPFYPTVFSGPVRERFIASLKESPPSWLVLRRRTGVQDLQYPLNIIYDAETFLNWLGLGSWLHDRYSLSKSFGPFQIYRLETSAFAE